jgi:inosine triphosphate pyrophosphatase
MKFYFMTSNENKYLEVKKFLKGIRDVLPLVYDLPEMQHTDEKEIVRLKLEVGKKHRKGEIIVEDTGLHLDCLNGLPGPFIKWFVKILGPEGIYDMAKRLGNLNAEARCVIGYCNKTNEFFEGSIRGKLVPPRGENGFGWDPIFLPDGHDKTFAEMPTTEKNAISHRGIALDKLKGFLE